MGSDEAVSTNLRVFMALQRETHEQVAAVLGFTRPALSARLNGRTAWSLNDIDRLAAHYGIPPGQLLAPPPNVLDKLRGPGGLLDPLGRQRRRPNPRTTGDRRRRPDPVDQAAAV